MSLRKSIDNNAGQAEGGRQHAALAAAPWQVVATCEMRTVSTCILLQQLRQEHFTSHCLMYFVSKLRARSSCHRHPSSSSSCSSNAILKRLEDIFHYGFSWCLCYCCHCHCVICATACVLQLSWQCISSPAAVAVVFHFTISSCALLLTMQTCFMAALGIALHKLSQAVWPFARAVIYIVYRDYRQTSAFSFLLPLATWLLNSQKTTYQRFQQFISMLQVELSPFCCWSAKV